MCERTDSNGDSSSGRAAHVSVSLVGHVVTSQQRNHLVEGPPGVCCAAPLWQDLRKQRGLSRNLQSVCARCPPRCVHFAQLAYPALEEVPGTLPAFQHQSGSYGLTDHWHARFVALLLEGAPRMERATTDGTSGVTNPTGPWCMLLSWFAFNFVLLFGRNLFPATSRLEPKVFLDKACIHQTDALLKEAGISSLGEFTFFSWSLVVLDSEDYLRRLWTVYELASFMIIRPRGRVVYLPVNLSVFVSVTCAAFLIVGLLLFVVKLEEVNDAVNLGLPSAVLGFVFVLQTTAMSVKSPLWFFVFGDESSCSGIDLRFFLFVGGARANRCHRHSICHAKIPATHSRRSLLVSFGFSPRSSTEKVIVFRKAIVSQALNARLRRTVCLSKRT